MLADKIVGVRRGSGHVRFTADERAEAVADVED
jgi:hypothetical protein